MRTAAFWIRLFMESARKSATCIDEDYIDAQKIDEMGYTPSAVSGEGASSQGS